MISIFDSSMTSLRSTLSQLLISFALPRARTPSSFSSSSSEGLDQYRLLVDLGSDSRRRTLNPFSYQAFSSMSSLSASKKRAGRNKTPSPVSIAGGGGGGLYFEIEAYHDLQQSMSISRAKGAGSGSGPESGVTPQTLTHTTPLTNPTPTLTPTAATTPTPGTGTGVVTSRKDKEKDRDQQHRVPGIRKRYKGSNGVLLDGGHFEHLMCTCTPHTATGTSSPSGGGCEGVIAVGMRLKIDTLVSLLLKTEEKKIEARKVLKRSSRNHESHKERDKEKQRERERERGKNRSQLYTQPSGEGLLDSFIRQHSSAPLTAVIMLRTVSHRPEGLLSQSSQQSSESYATVTQEKKSKFRDLGLIDSTDALLSTHSSTHLHLQSPAHPYSAMLMAATLCQLRASGHRVADSHVFPSELSRLRSASTPLDGNTPRRGDVDAMLSLCHAEGVPFLVLLLPEEEEREEERAVRHSDIDKDDDSPAPSAHLGQCCSVQVTSHHMKSHRSSASIPILLPLPLSISRLEPLQ